MHFFGFTVYIARQSDENQWIQADLRTSHVIASVTTQGRLGQHAQWVTSYYVSYSQDGTDWTDIPTLYSGNVDQESKVTNRLPANTLARYVRLRPHQWNNGIALRFDATGCAVARKLSHTVARSKDRVIMYSHCRQKIL